MSELTGQAIRHPKRGKAHRMTTDVYVSTLHPNSTVCGRWARDMTERIPAAQTAPEDRCTRCFPADHQESTDE